MADPKTAELVVAAPQALSVNSRPSFIEEDREQSGTEHLTDEDVKFPRLALAQSTSPEIDESDPKFIDGLKVGTLFNSLTRQVYGTGPLDFCILRSDPPVYIEFGPDGKSIVDRDVPPNDPRTQFGPNGEKPQAQKFYNYIIMLLPTQELIALSFKSTGLKTAKELNGLIKARGNVKICAGKYAMSAAMTKNDKGKYGIYVVRNSGWVPEALYPEVKAMFEGFRNRVVVIDQDAADEFNPHDLEKQGSGAPTGDTEGM